MKQLLPGIVMGATIGVLLGICGIHWQTWQFWVLCIAWNASITIFEYLGKNGVTGA